MVAILVTGMSGTGKSAVLTELGRRGHQVVDTDYGASAEIDTRKPLTEVADELESIADMAGHS